MLSLLLIIKKEVENINSIKMDTPELPPSWEEYYCKSLVKREKPEETSCFTMEYTTKFKGEEKMKSEKIINLWRSNQRDAILNSIYTKEDEILNLDPLYSSVKKHVDEIDKILSEQGFNKISDEIRFKSYTTNTTDALLSQNKADEVKWQKDLDEQYTEICAMLSACDTYEQEMKVLKAYRIVNEDGKLVEDVGNWR